MISADREARARAMASSASTLSPGLITASVRLADRAAARRSFNEVVALIRWSRYRTYPSDPASTKRSRCTISLDAPGSTPAA